MGKGKASRDTRCAETAFSDLASPVVDLAAEQAREVAQEPSVEGFHQIRIMMRILLTLWWFYRPLTDSREFIRHRTIYKSIANAAGKARDFDILVELLRLQGKSTSASTPEISAARNAAVDAGKEVLSPLSIQMQLGQILSQTSANLTSRHSCHQLRDFADKRVAKSEKQLRKQIAQALRVKKPDLAALHDVRKLAKKTRYLLELLEPVLSRGHRSTLIRIKKTLKPLGELNDVVVSEMLLRDNPSFLSGTDRPKKIRHWFKKERKRRLRASACLLRNDWS
ncbi:CHAD domain-containing protein [Comamonas sp.]|uniref:CHAD domain-containing protein n=1 Tax=Comamonas sp. TaxID=34028 RepID=UPI003A939133